MCSCARGQEEVIYPDASVEDWQKKYKLPIIDSECSKCHRIFKMNVPILMQGCAGFSSQIHECGENFCSVILTPKSEKSKAFWRSVVGPSF